MVVTFVTIDYYGTYERHITDDQCNQIKYFRTKVQFEGFVQLFESGRTGRETVFGLTDIAGICVLEPLSETVSVDKSTASPTITWSDHMVDRIYFQTEATVTRITHCFR